MTVTLYAGWDMASLASPLDPTATLAWTRGTGKTANVGPTGTYCHRSLASVLGSNNYSDFATVLKAAMDAQGGGPYTVTWTEVSSPKRVSYKISTTVGSWTIDSGTDTTMRAILGTGATFPLSSVLNGSDHTIDLDVTVNATCVRPYFVIAATQGGVSETSDDYEPRDSVKGAYADDGTPYSTHPITIPKFNDLTFVFELEAQVRKRKATSAVPWTFEHFWEHARGTYPFLVSDTADAASVYHMRAERGHFEPSHIQPDWAAYYNLRVSAFLRGRL